MKAYMLKVTLIDSEPLIWRSVIIPAEISFQRLHEVLQCLMLWKDYHQYEFLTPDDKFRFAGDQKSVDEFYEAYADSQEKPQWQYKLAGKTKIDSLLKKHRQLDYTYDFGAFWQLRIILEGVQENYSKTYATCLEGENPAPPEDVDGLDGYRVFLKAIDNTEHVDHEEMIELGADWQREFDKRTINQELRAVILKRMPKANTAKKDSALQISDKIVSLFSAEAKWLAIPKSVRDRILMNGFCTNCRGTTEIVDCKVSSSGKTVYIEGVCKKCGGKVVRCLD